MLQDLFVTFFLPIHLKITTKKTWIGILANSAQIISAIDTST